MNLTKATGANLKDGLYFKNTEGYNRWFLAHRSAQVPKASNGEKDACNIKM